MFSKLYFSLNVVQRATCRLLPSTTPLQKWPIFFCLRKSAMYLNVCKNIFLYFLILLFNKIFILSFWDDIFANLIQKR